MNYRGVLIERGANLYSAFMLGHGMLRADTISGIKSLINERIAAK
jgi:hypothetical protein